MRENVLGLTVVIPSGTIIRTGTRATKSSSGLGLTRLHVGSEGVLGLITEVRLRLYGPPESTVAAICQFPTLEAAMDTVITVRQAGVAMVRIELASAMQMHMCVRYSKLDDLEEFPTLFLEFHGSAAATQDQARWVEEIATEMGASRFAYAGLPEERTRLWTARHANLRYSPGKSVMGTDACVPLSALVDCITQMEADVALTGLLAPMIGHVGNGNFHLGVLFDPADADERAIALGGTCSGSMASARTSGAWPRWSMANRPRSWGRSSRRSIRPAS